VLLVTFTIAIALKCLDHDPYTDIVIVHVALRSDAVYQAIARLRTSFGRTARTWRLFNLARNLLNGDVEVGGVDLAVDTVGHLGSADRLEGEAEGLLDGVGLAGWRSAPPSARSPPTTPPASSATFTKSAIER